MRLVMKVNGKVFVNSLHDQIQLKGLKQLNPDESEVLDKKIQDFVKNLDIADIDIPDALYEKIIHPEEGALAQSENPELVQTIESCYQFIHDEEGWTPLHHAAASGNVKEVQRLIQSGRSKIDERTPLGSTPLSIALLEGHLGVVKELIDKGANIYNVDSEGSTIFDILERKKRIALKCNVIFKHLKNTYPELYTQNKESRRRKMLSHAWSLGGYSQLKKLDTDFVAANVKLTGSFGSESFHLMAKHLTKLKEKDPLILSGTRANFLKEAITFAAGQDAHTNEEILERVGQGKPTFINAGYSGHAVTLLIYKDQFVISNQGNFSRRPMEIYHFNKDLFTLQTLEKIFEVKADTSEKKTDKYKKLYFEELPKELGFTQDEVDLTLEEVAPLPPQVVGNCAWVSPHIALAALMMISRVPEKGASKIIEEEMNVFNTIHQSEQFYVLESSLNSLKKGEQYFKLDHDLIETALHKAYLLPLDATMHKRLEEITEKYKNSLEPLQQTQLLSTLQFWKTHTHDLFEGDERDFYIRMKETIQETLDESMNFFDDLMSQIEKDEG